MVVRKNKATVEEEHEFVKGAKIVDNIPIPQFMSDTCLPYAVSVIRERALIDNQDGLKPVQRRILWTLFEDGVLPNKEYVKVARLAGNVLRYHPHGNTSVEQALVRMAQPYSLRVPLIDGKGSFGAHPGDEAAASRYIEARLNQNAVELLAETSTDCQPMTPNFDSTLQEPVVLPVRWPVSVINGSQGIAVGYAANMPQHNPTETLNACKQLLENPKMTIKQLQAIMPGPDFWTGGTLYGVKGVAEYYETGRGSFIVRAKYRSETLNRGKVRLTFYELPPNVSCESVVETVRKLVNDSGNKNSAVWKGISRIDDLTGRVNENDVRLVVELKAGANEQQTISSLYKYTQLQQSFNVNNTVVRKGRPQVIGVKTMLQDFLDLRKTCVIERSKHYKSVKERRISQIDSILAVLLDIDKAISIIRQSNTVETAKTKLMKEIKISETQAEYVLNMQLRKLTRQDSVALKTERKQLVEDCKELDKIINDSNELRKVIEGELDEEIKIIGDRRRMEISKKELE